MPVKLIMMMNDMLDNDFRLPFSAMWYSSQSLVDRTADENAQPFTGTGDVGHYYRVRRTGVEGDPIPAAGVPGMSVDVFAQKVLPFSQPSATIFRFMAQDSLIRLSEEALLEMKDGEKSVEEFADYRDAAWRKKYPYVPPRLFPCGIMFGFSPPVGGVIEYTISKGGDEEAKDWMDENELHLPGSLKRVKRDLDLESSDVCLRYSSIRVSCLCFSSYKNLRI